MDENASIDEQVSIRGLTEGFQSPLKQFKGRYAGHKTEPAYDPKKIRVILQFTDVDVIDSTEPYQFPTAEIRINHSTKKGSMWGIFSESLLKLIDDDKDLKDCKGMVLEMKLTPDHHFGENKDTGEEIVRSAWEVLSVEGKKGSTSKVNASDRALQLLNGKTLAQFHQIAFADPAIKGDTALQEAILDETFVTAMLAAGKLTKDKNEIYHTK